MPGDLFQIFICDESGQGITEYGAVIAFIGLIITLVFTITQGQLGVAVSNSFSVVVSQIHGLDNTAAS